MIYPEGTRFSPARRERVLENLARAGGPAGDARAGGPAGDARVRTPTSRLLRARALTHVLPPRPGGVLGLLAACPEADVLVVAHTGLEGARTLASLWRGELIGREVRVALWRVSARAVPLDPAARQDWLLGQWERLNAWVAAAA